MDQNVDNMINEYINNYPSLYPLDNPNIPPKFLTRIVTRNISCGYLQLGLLQMRMGCVSPLDYSKKHQIEYVIPTTVVAKIA